MMSLRCGGTRPAHVPRACRAAPPPPLPTQLRSAAPCAPPPRQVAGSRGVRSAARSEASTEDKPQQADARQLLGIKGAAMTNDKWALRLQARVVAQLRLS